MKSSLICSVFVALTTTLAACASNPSGSTSESAHLAQTSDPSKGIVCVTERPTNSFLKETTCTTRQEREANRRQQELLMDVR